MFVTHFRTTIDATRIGNTPPRRTRQTVVWKFGGGDERRLTITTEAFDFGKPVVVEPPPSEQVREFDPTAFGGAFGSAQPTRRAAELDDAGVETLQVGSCTL